MTLQQSILLLCADMASAMHFSCYGGPAGLTPAIDSLAANGIRFTNAYCVCPPCIPARVSMMCGQYGHTHGKSAHLKMPLTPQPALLPGILAANGYRTGIVGMVAARLQPGVSRHVPDDRQRAEERTGGVSFAPGSNLPAPDHRRLRRTQAGTSAARRTRAVEQTGPRTRGVPAKRIQRHRHGGPQHRQDSAQGERPRPGG